jgi:hypothetical protein
MTLIHYTGKINDRNGNEFDSTRAGGQFSDQKYVHVNVHYWDICTCVTCGVVVLWCCGVAVVLRCCGDMNLGLRPSAR